MPVLLAAILSHASSQLIHLSLPLYINPACTIASARVLSLCSVWRVLSVIAACLHLCCLTLTLALLCRPINSSGLVDRGRQPPSLCAVQ